jgi:hemin uptake protein HemP
MRQCLNKDGMADSTTTIPAANSAASSEAGKPVVVVESGELFHGQREVCILHDGERYRLRITRRGKLILQK